MSAVRILADMIGPLYNTTVIETYGYVRAVPLPYHGTWIERLRAALLVLTGRAYAVRWPQPGDLEKALDR